MVYHNLLSLTVTKPSQATSSRSYSHYRGVQLKLSLAYYPHMDDQKKIVNNTLEIYMRYFLVDSLKDWSNWVALDTTPPIRCQKPPFEAFYVFSPPNLLDYILGTTKVKRVDLNLKTKEQISSILQYSLQKTQDRMKLYANLRRKRTDL